MSARNPRIHGTGEAWDVWRLAGSITTGKYQGEEDELEDQRQAEAEEYQAALKAAEEGPTDDT